MPLNWRIMTIGGLLLVAVVIAAVIVVAPAVLRRNPLRKSRRPVEEHTWVGYSEAALRKMLGQPQRVVAGYEKVGPKAMPIPPGPYRTLIYEHPDGFLFVWLNDSGNGFACFDSLWFNRGVWF
jgi:hypothetical protein